MDRRWAIASIAALAIATLAQPPSAMAADAGQPLSLTVAEATVRKEEATGQPVLDIRLAPQSQLAFAEFTGRHVGQRVALRVDGLVLMAPVIREPIQGGRMTISGGYGAQAVPLRELNAIAARLGAGATTLEAALQTEVP